MTSASAVQGVDPRTGAPVGSGVPLTTPEELDAVLAAAAEAAPRLAGSGPAELAARADLLVALADALDAAGPRLVPLAVAESGLPEARLTGEVARTSGQLRLFAEVVRDGAFLDVVVDAADADLTPPRPALRRWLEPLGPVLVFGASNFPFAFSVLGGDTASALAAGCPVVVKAHGSHPGLSHEVAELARDVVARAGFPVGTFALVVGDESGPRAVQDDRVRAAGFTGSTAGGTFLAGLAARRPRPIPFFAEMGSVNPVVVLPAAAAARPKELARDFVASMSLGAGQFCTKPGILLVPAGAGLDTHLAAAVEETTAAPMLNGSIHARLDHDLTALADHPQVRPLGRGAAAPEEGFWATPALFATTAEAVAASPELLAEEHFGPCAVIAEYTSAEEVGALLRALGGSLTATVQADDADAEAAASLLPVLGEISGRVIWNGWPTGVAVTWAMQHGGPWPATTDARFTSVGATATTRWMRPVCYQNLPDPLLPAGLRDDALVGLPRRENGILRGAASAG